MAEFAGSYAFTSDDGNFGSFLKELGVGFVKRNIAAKAKPTIEISVAADGTITVKTISLQTSVISFKLDEEFQQLRLDDKTVRTIVKKEGNKLIETQPDENCVIEREFKGDTLTTTCTCNNVTCVRTYTKKQA